MDRQPDRQPYETGAARGGAVFDTPWAPRAAATVGWLLAEGQRLPEMEGLFAAFCHHLAATGLPLVRSTLHLRLLHPQLRGITYVWREGAGGLETIERRHGVELDPTFRTSPIAAIIEDGAEGLRTFIARTPGPYPYPIIDELKAEGVTDYAALPLAFSSGRRHAMTIATKAPDGFETAELGTVYDVAPAFAALLEARAYRFLASTLLDTYVGRQTGARILAGDIRRGSGETLRSVLWYCDLRGFTPLSDRLPREQLIALLNGYFEIMGGAVQANGGEILKFVGDALLAIFPLGETGEQDAACRALQAALDAVAGMKRLNAQRAAWGQPILKAGIALHVGDVMYGNIGAPDRLDFTVIGPAVNLVSRIEGLCKRLDREVLASCAFAANCGDSMVSLGFQPVKGMTRPVEVFGLTG